MIPSKMAHKFPYKKLAVLALTPVLSVCLLSSPALAKKKKKKKAETTATQTQAATTSQTPASVKETKTGSTASTTAKKKSTHATATSVSPSEVSNAKAKGMVWVNTDSKVYHTGGKYYGNTKHGQFMSQADARKAGYRAAKN